MHTNTKEFGLESLIVNWLVEQNGYKQGISADYNRENTHRFIEKRQREIAERKKTA